MLGKAVGGGGCKRRGKGTRKVGAGYWVGWGEGGGRGDGRVGGGGERFVNN